MREDKIVAKDWGYETWFENNELYCGKILVCRDGIWSSDGWWHYHPIKDETFYVLSGTLELDIEGKSQYLEPNDSQRILPGTRHRFRSNTKYCAFVEVSTSHSDTDSIRVKTLEEGRDE